MSYQTAVLRGGLLGHGTMLRADWLPTRGRTLGLGMQLPLGQPAGANGVRTVLLAEELLDVAEEVRLLDVREPLARREMEVAVCLCALELGGRDVAVHEHREELQQRRVAPPTLEVHAEHLGLVPGE